MFKKTLPISLTFAINGANETRRSTRELSDSTLPTAEPAERVGAGGELGVGRDVAQKQKPWRPGLLPSKNCRKASFSSSTSMLLFPLQAKAVRPQEIGAVLGASKPMNSPGNLHILFLDVKHLFSHQLEPVKTATFSSVIRR